MFGLLLLADPSHAAGTTSAAFLRLGAGARATAMGETFTALADDASATYWNPAGMANLDQRELMAEHSSHLQGISVERVAYANPLGHQVRGRPAWGVSAAYLSLEGIEGRSGNTAQPDRLFGASDFYSALSYAHPLNRSRDRAFSLGVTGKVIQQKIDTRQATAYALDVGLLKQWGRWQAGATLSNLGTQVRFIEESFPLPQTLRAGLSRRAAHSPLTVALGLEHVKGNSAPSYRLGFEYTAGSLLALRAGYLTRSGDSQRALKGTTLGTVTDSELNRFTGLVGGVGFRIFGYGLDYAFTPYGELGNTHQISLSAKFK